MSLDLDPTTLLANPERLLHHLDTLDYEESLYLFLREAWRRIDPAPWFDSWALQAIAEHLEAVVDGEISCLIINQPPRTGKSSMLAVAFPAWVWAQRVDSPTSGPGAQMLFASYADRLSLRDSVKCRRLIKSDWYQQRWGSRFSLNDDQDTKHRFGNDKGGERLITSVGAGVTGEGGNLICIDDPNATNEALSEAAIQEVVDWWDQTMSTRRNDPEHGAYIINQQRMAEEDLSGHVLSQGGDVVHLCLPMRYEADRSFVTVLGWRDPRTVEGDLLWPERISEKSVKELEHKLGPWGSAGQLQQRPEPKGGGIIKRDWWLTWREKDFPPLDFIMVSVDTAFTEKTENDPSACTVWGVFTSDPVAQPGRYIDSDGRPQYVDRIYTETTPSVILMDAWREWLPLHELVAKVAATAKKNKADMVLIENKASGISLENELRRLYSHETFSLQFFDPKSQDKQARLHSVVPLFAPEIDARKPDKLKRLGIVYAPEKLLPNGVVEVYPWAEMVITEVSQFPKGRYRDLTDTTSQALIHLRNMGLLTLAPERLAEIEESKRYQKELGPLYPA